MGVGVKGNGLNPRHVDSAVHHDVLIRGDVDHLADDATAIFPVLILDELTFQTDGELVDDRRIHGFCLAGGQPAAGKFVRYPVAGFHAEVVGLHHVGGIGNADGKGPPAP